MSNAFIGAGLHSLILLGTLAGVACMGIYGLINATDWIASKYGRLDA